jgi:hypothetical protein
MRGVWIGHDRQPTMTTILLVVLVLSILYLALRVRNLENAVNVLAQLVNKPRRRDHALLRIT